jgi:hypothetical protein
MAAMPPGLLAHFQQLNGKKSKTGSITTAKPSAGTRKTAPGRKKPKKGKVKSASVVKGLTPGQRKLPIGLQQAILRAKGL